MDDDDPFACFDGSDDDESKTNKEEKDVIQHTVTKETKNSLLIDQQLGNKLENKSIRDESCGVLAFHPNTERSLLLHVENELQSQQGNNFTSKGEAVLRSIDKYCFERHWMMNVGPSKGKLVQDFLIQCLEKYYDDCSHDNDNTFESFVKTKQKKQNNKHQSFVAVELGTYCGYSSILMVQKAKQYLKMLQQKRNTPETTSGDNTLNDDLLATTSLLSSFHLYTVEVDPTHIDIARKLIQLAKLENFITVLTYVPANQSLNELLQESIPIEQPDQEENNNNQIDFLFIDHDKDLYLNDLQHLEETKWIQAGTYVAADNVIFAQIHDYCDHVQTLSKAGIVQTRLEEAQIEYCDPDIQQQQQQQQQQQRLNKDNNCVHEGETSIDKTVFRDGIAFDHFVVAFSP